LDLGKFLREDTKKNTGTVTTTTPTPGLTDIKKESKAFATLKITNLAIPE